MIEPAALSRAFDERFGRAPCIFRAPGRVNLLGEHTDYNDGFVMPIAIDRFTYVAAAPRRDRTVVVRSQNLDEEADISLEAPPGGPAGRWTDYVRGVATLLESEGADLLVASDVPIGAGLSSSAALEVACARAVIGLRGESMDATTIAQLCQQAEHRFAGTRCGIMDQMAACHGRAGHAMMLDTRTLARTYVPLPAAARVLVCNTGVRHAHAAGEYNRRRADCEAGVAVLRRTQPSVRALRDVTLQQLTAARAELSALVWARCRHVITENDRVVQAADALSRGDLRRVGQLMAASHVSLRDEFEVSCTELDVMTTIVSGLDGVYGARMTGGGFGGCVVALADASSAAAAMRQASERYAGATGRRPDIWITVAADAE